MASSDRMTFGSLVRAKDAGAEPMPDHEHETETTCSEGCDCSSADCPCKGECGPDCACGCAASQEAEAEPKTYTFRANDGEYDRYNDRLKPEGWKLDDFNANPIILYNHDAGTGGWFTPPTKTLPIGKGRAYVAPLSNGTRALFVDIQFDPDDDFARQVEGKVAKGILSAVSVRYRMVEGKYRENEKHGYDCDEMELLEISVVTIPGNQRALRVKDFAPADLAVAIKGAELFLAEAMGPGSWVRRGTSRPSRIPMVLNVDAAQALEELKVVEGQLVNVKALAQETIATLERVRELRLDAPAPAPPVSAPGREASTPSFTISVADAAKAVADEFSQLLSKEHAR